MHSPVRLLAWPAGAAAAAGVALLLVGLWAPGSDTSGHGSVVLLPSMGPTLALQLRAPELPASGLRAALLGHGVGLLAGAVAAVLVALVVDPSGGGGSAALAGAAALALTLWATVRLDAEHPPAAATTLIVALGFLPATPIRLARAALALVLCVLLGEVLRRVTLKNG